MKSGILERLSIGWFSDMLTWNVRSGCSLL